MKKIISTLLVLSMIFATGCSANGALSGWNQNQSSTTPIKVIDETISMSGSSAVTVSATTTTMPVFSTKDIRGKVKDIYYGNDSKVIVLADKLYLYDLAKGKVLSNADLPTTSIYFVQPIKDGYAVIGENDTHSSGGSGMVSGGGSVGTKCTFYDNNLKKTTEICLSDIHKDGHSVIFSDHIAVSSDGRKLAFTSRFKLYLYDIAQKQITLLIDPDSKNANGIAMIEQIGFTNNDKSIAFGASTFDLPIVDGSKSFPTCGLINIDGTGLINNKTSGYSIYEMTNAYDGFALYSEDFRKPTGRFLKMNTKTGKTELLKATEKKETEYAVGSDNGAYYATAFRGKSSWAIRIYDTKTNKLISEQKAEFGKEIYGNRIPSVKLIDATKTCIILLGATQSAECPTKVFVSQF